MQHDTLLISTIVAGLVLAYILGLLANRLRLPPLVGYLLAGILVAPFMPRLGADAGLARQLAELGVVLLMFGTGLHFSLRDLARVRALAIPGALAQIALATLLGTGLGLLLGWDMGGALLFGLALSVASSLVAVRALQDKKLFDTERLRIARGWLVVEDLVMVLALVLVPALAALGGIETGIHDPFVSFVERLVGNPIGIWGVLAITLVKLAAFVGFMLVAGRRLIPQVLDLTAGGGSRELSRLAVLAIVSGMALGSAALFGVPLALGAFFAGMILAESARGRRAASEMLPLREAFAVLFFLALGMLFDPAILIEQPLLVLGTLVIIMIGKSLAAFAILLAFRRPVGTALTIAAALAQIGEFSFVLVGMGVAFAILPPGGYDLILAAALLSILVNPLMFWIAERVRPALEARFGGPDEARSPVAPIEPSLGAALAEHPGMDEEGGHSENLPIAAVARGPVLPAVMPEPEPEPEPEMETAPETETGMELIGEAPAEIDEIVAPAPDLATPDEADAPAEDIPKVLQAPPDEKPAIAAIIEPVRADEGTGLEAVEPIEVVVPPVEPEPRRSGGKRKT